MNDKLQRITEQDAMEIGVSAFKGFDKYADIDTWFEVEGHSLLAKLNERREPDAGQEPYRWTFKFNNGNTANIYETYEQAFNDYEPSEGKPMPLYAAQVTANKAEVPSLKDFEKFIADLKEIVWLDAVKEENQPSFEDSGIELYVKFINKFFNKEYEAAKNGESI